MIQKEKNKDLIVIRLKRVDSVWGSWGESQVLWGGGVNVFFH